MPLWKNYHQAHSINDALQALMSAPGPAKLLAGGTDLILDLQQERHPDVDTLVDVTAIPELLMVEKRADDLYIGAAVPLSQIVRSQLINEHAQTLVEACDLIGGPQVRNAATLGGNVAHALPAADGTIALLALGAQAEVADHAGLRTEPLQALFHSPGHSNLDPKGELLVGFYLPLRKNLQSSAFKRVMRPQGVALPVLNLAVWLQRQSEAASEDSVADIRIAVGPGGPTPTRAYSAEEVLRGQFLNTQTISLALKTLLDQVHFRTSPRRATSAYRQHLAGVLLRDVIYTAWERTF